MDYFIEFSYNDESVFRRIFNLIDYIKMKKDSEQLDCNDTKIIDFYNENEIEYFWWPTEEEAKEFWDKYYSLEEEERYLFLKSNNVWDLESVIDSISAGEYEIIGCKRVREGVGIFYFKPWAYPYGGADPLVQLIKPFDIKILRVER